MRTRVVGTLLLLVLAGCVSAPNPTADDRKASTQARPSTVAKPTDLPRPASPTRQQWAFPVKIERRVSDAATATFAADVMATLTDPRGWRRAGFVFVEDPGAVATIVLAEGDEVDRLCLPYDTYGRYSCQNGPVVALNADRWRTATRSWPSSLQEYRTMLVNHEVGHLLHLHHPKPQCPGAGLPAPIMAQQSTELGVCLPNPWPLRWEIRLATERREELAPPASHDTSDHRPTPPPARS